MNLFAKFFFLMFIGSSFALSQKPIAETVRWEKYTEALSAAQKDHKLVFVDLYATWCIPCQVMAANTFTDKAVVNLLNSRFHPVRLDVDSPEIIDCDGKKNTPERCFFDVWELDGVPSYVLIAPKGTSILTLTQALDAGQMRILLFQFLNKEKEWISE
ncbi:MAG: thioredoxin family protein [Fibrobacteraceae bacterium]|nr:thioredoxin family protein [Fibrobacteraceae bacterium]